MRSTRPPTGNSGAIGPPSASHSHGNITWSRTAGCRTISGGPGPTSLRLGRVHECHRRASLDRVFSIADVHGRIPGMVRTFPRQVDRLAAEALAEAEERSGPNPPHARVEGGSDRRKCTDSALALISSRGCRHGMQFAYLRDAPKPALNTRRGGSLDMSGVIPHVKNFPLRRPSQDCTSRRWHGSHSCRGVPRDTGRR